MLTPGSDYADLADALEGACASLATGAVAGITSADCLEVAKATTATKMHVFSGPSEPRDVSVIGGDHQIRVRWSAPATDGTAPVNSYVLTVSPAIEGQNFLAIDDRGARDITVGGIPAGRTLTFRLLAVSSAGTSSPRRPPSPFGAPS